jgi:uncharacterized tellurite resistance protein B-like protein
MGTMMRFKLGTFFDELLGAAPAERDFAPDDYRIAAAALLVHMAVADGHVAPQEQRRLRRIVEERFELDTPSARRLIENAEARERESVDLFQFTSILKRALDETGRLAVVELLWDMAYADGVADEIEENVVWRIAELLGVSGRDRMALKHKSQRSGAESLPDQAWDEQGEEKA